MQLNTDVSKNSNNRIKDESSIFFNDFFLLFWFFLRVFFDFLIIVPGIYNIEQYTHLIIFSPLFSFNI